MCRYVSKMLLGALVIVSSFGGIALSDDAKFTFTNSAPEKLYLNLFSKTRDGWRWPSSRTRWILEAGQQGTAIAGQCRPGEKICYGAANQNRSRFWGISLDGRKGCSSCCIDCGNSHRWNLTEHSDPPSQPHIFDNGPVLVPANE